ncbi:hypothetical protein vseg_015372 [Gypsophila vaccaria]
MATTKSYRFLSTELSPKPTHARGASFDLNESDIWGGGGATQSNSNPPQMSRPPRRYVGGREVAAASVPVNVPDWGKILRGEYNKEKWSITGFGGGRDYDEDDNEQDEEEEEWVPPHEYLSRTRNASLSVQEGFGRTLKGRDLSRVRNAIWKRTGFQD